jgi:hypothetical protein
MSNKTIVVCAIAFWCYFWLVLYFLEVNADFLYKLIR